MSHDVSVAETPSVSVIIPVYGRPFKIIRAVRSALRQSVGPEVIIVDDASTVFPSLVYRTLAAVHKRVSVFRMPERSGAGTCRNRGLGESHGEFVAFLDSDDVYPCSDSLKAMVDRCGRDGTDVCGSLRELSIGGYVESTELYREECRRQPDGLVLDFKDVQYEYDYTSYIYRRSLLVDNGIRFPPFPRYQDVPFFVEAMGVARTFSVAPVVGYRYTIDPKHPLAYDVPKTVGLLRSMLSVIEIAERYGFDEIVSRTGRRLREEYLPRIPPDVLESQEVADLIDDVLHRSAAPARGWIPVL
ncbi:MAG: glycosyltransferase family 2 protein [Candidatus Methanomethylophilaceae archaeon]|nr:glycosyltransferase family 2 protein [Candidatus Methanomethylophilaceae archaeon]